MKKIIVLLSLMMVSLVSLVSTNAHATLEEDINQAKCNYIDDILYINNYTISEYMIFADKYFYWHEHPEDETSTLYGETLPEFLIVLNEEDASEFYNAGSSYIYEILRLTGEIETLLNIRYDWCGY